MPLHETNASRITW